MGMVIGNQEIIGCVVGNKLVYEADPIVTINYVLKDTGESVGTYDIPFVKTGTADEKDVMNVSDSQDENGNYVAKGHIPGGYRGYVTGTGVWEDLNSAKNALPWSQLNYWVKENNRTQQINVQLSILLVVLTSGQASVKKSPRPICRSFKRLPIPNFTRPRAD